MDKSTTFRIRTPQIAHETVENEAVVVNLESGIYYSLRNVAATIWQLIEAGASVERIRELLCSAYPSELMNIERSTEVFVTLLVDEGLIALQARKFNSEASVGWPSEGYRVPVVEKFDDMAQLLLLDPIHDVDETGWPEKAE